MCVSDVEDAFLILPLHPDLWLFMLFRWAYEGGDSQEHLFAHLFADFGAAGTPGSFQIFLVRVVVQMARSGFTSAVHAPPACGSSRVTSMRASVSPASPERLRIP